jgi:hypothetical protein
MMIAKKIESKTIGSLVNEFLTIAEIEDRYPSEWILIEDPITSDENGLESGRVVFHSPDRDEMHRKVIELRPQQFAFHYTGRMLPNTAIAL